MRDEDSDSDENLNKCDRTFLREWQREGIMGSVIKSHRRKPSVRRRVGVAVVYTTLAAGVGLGVTQGIIALGDYIQEKKTGPVRFVKPANAAADVSSPQVKVPKATAPAYISFAKHCFEQSGAVRTGISLAASTGTRARAVLPGRVVFAGEHESYGTAVVVQHADNWQTTYAHLGRVDAKIGVGVNVTQRQVLGLSGYTGAVKSPQLHFAVSKGTLTGPTWSEFVNPVPWLSARGVKITGC